MDILSVMTTLIVTVILGLVINLVFAMYLQPRAVQMREAIRRSKIKWVRKLYVKSTLRAAQGHDSIVDTQLIGIFFATGVTVLIILCVFMPGVLNDRLEESDARVEELEEALAGRDEELSLEVMEANAREFIAESQEVFRSARWQLLVIRLLGASMAIQLLWVVFVWLPMMIYTRLVGRRLDEIMRLFVRLLDVDELVALAQMSGRLTNQEDLKAYLDLLTDSARKHGLSHLVTRVNPWGEEHS